MFAKQVDKPGEAASVWGISDPLRRRFLSGVCIGIAVGIFIGRFVDRLFP